MNNSTAPSPGDQGILKSVCYLCDEPIEYSSELIDQIIECPHCKQRIKLFAASPGRLPESDKTGPNALLKTRKERLLAWLAILLFACSILRAPWEIVMSRTHVQDTRPIDRLIRGGDRSTIEVYQAVPVTETTTRTVFSPIFFFPTTPTFSGYPFDYNESKTRLRIEVLLISWIAIAVLAAGLIVLTRGHGLDRLHPTLSRSIDYLLGIIVFTMGCIFLFMSLQFFRDWLIQL